MGGTLPLGIRLNRLAQPVLGYIPFQNATRSLLNGKPAHVGTAYSLAPSVAVEGEDIKASWTVDCPNHVAERYCRHGKMPSRRDASFDPFASRFLSAHRGGIDPRRKLKRANHKKQRCHFRGCGDHARQFR